MPASWDILSLSDYNVNTPSSSRSPGYQWESVRDPMSSGSSSFRSALSSPPVVPPRAPSFGPNLTQSPGSPSWFHVDQSSSPLGSPYPPNPGGPSRRPLKQSSLPHRPALRRGEVFELRSDGTSVPYASDSNSEASTNAEATDLTGRVQMLNQRAILSGGFSDVYQGILLSFVGAQPDQLARSSAQGSRHVKVAIKILRARIAGAPNEDEVIQKMNRRLKREIRSWQELDHPNILPLCGFCYDFSGGVQPAALISPWMENGDINTYIKRRRMSTSERIELICDIANGLEYMHFRGIVHGDLKGANILVDVGGRARLGDFGLSRIVRDVTATTPGLSLSYTSSWAGSDRWMSPELHCPVTVPGPPLVTTASDVWAFAHTALEIVTGKCPYYYHPTGYLAICDIVNRVLPRRPTSEDRVDDVLSDSLWSILKACWAYESSRRPSLRDVARQLRGMS